MNETSRRVAVFGGSGFIGTVLAEHLTRAGHQALILTRSRERARDVWLLPAAHCVEYDPGDAAALAAALAGCDAAVNLVGILNEKGDDGSGYRRVHVDLTRSVIDACGTAGVTRYLHMSALKAAPVATSHYQRTKGEAEMLVRGSGLEWTIFRPSLVFGPGDGLLNRFEALTRFAPVLPLACAQTRFQPVYVGDVAAAFVRALDDRRSIGQSYDLGGPAVMTLAELLDKLLTTLGRRRLVLPLGLTASRLQAEMFEHLPGKPFSRDNFRAASEDAVVTGENGFERLGIVPVAIDGMIARCLGRGGERQRYDELRRHAGR